MKSKLGYHIILPHDVKEYESRIIAAQPAILKFTGHGNDWFTAKRYMDALPNTTFVLRDVGYNDETAFRLIKLKSPPEDVAKWHSGLIAKDTAKYGLEKGFWEAVNEPGKEYAKLITDFEVARMGKMMALGLKSMIFNWSVGVPELEDWNNCIPAVRLVQKYGSDICRVGLHEYWPDGDVFKGVDAFRMGWWFLRYRRIWKITGEFAIDFTEFGFDNPPLAALNLNAETVLEKFKQADAELQADEFVDGAAIFTVNFDQWQDHRLIGPHFDLVNMYIGNEQTTNIPKPPVVTPIPLPPEMQPHGEMGLFQVTPTGGNFRSSPKLDKANVQATLKGNTPIEIIEWVNDEWAKVQVGGYMHKSVLRKLPK